MNKQKRLKIWLFLSNNGVLELSSRQQTDSRSTLGRLWMRNLSQPPNRRSSRVCFCHIFLWLWYFNQGRCPTCPPTGFNKEFTRPSQTLPQALWHWRNQPDRKVHRAPCHLLSRGCAGSLALISTSAPRGKFCSIPVKYCRISIILEVESWPHAWQTASRWFRLISDNQEQSSLTTHVTCYLFAPDFETDLRWGSSQRPCGATPTIWTWDNFFLDNWGFFMNCGIKYSKMLINYRLPNLSPFRLAMSDFGAKWPQNNNFHTPPARSWAAAFLKKQGATHICTLCVRTN